MYDVLIALFVVCVVVLIVLVVLSVVSKPIPDHLNTLARYLLDDEEVTVTGNWVCNHMRILSFSTGMDDVSIEVCASETRCDATGSNGVAEVIFTVDGNPTETTINYGVSGSQATFTDGLDTFVIDVEEIDSKVFIEMFRAFTFNSLRADVLDAA